MNGAKRAYYRSLFLVAAVYDLVLGVAFTFFYRFTFNLLNIEDKLPNYGAYLSLIGAFFIVISIAYVIIYLGDLRQNRGLILVGALFKLSYAAVALAYYIIGDFPHILFVFLFGIIDFVFFVLMIDCFRRIPRFD